MDEKKKNYVQLTENKENKQAICFHVGENFKSHENKKVVV